MRKHKIDDQLFEEVEEKSFMNCLFEYREEILKTLSSFTQNIDKSEESINNHQLYVMRNHTTILSRLGKIFRKKSNELSNKRTEKNKRNKSKNGNIETSRII